MSNKRNGRFLLGIAVAILLPLSFYFLAKGLKKDHLNMPRYYVADSITGHMVDGKMVRDTVFHKVADLRGVNQLGDTVSLNKDLADKVLVVNFFFTTCPSVCPRLTSNIKMLQSAFRKDPKKAQTLDKDVQLISITVNPGQDSFQALRAYADRFGVNHDRWWFITGDKKALYNYARNELALSVGDGDGGADDFIHSEKLVIIDQQRHIRGYYDGLDSAQIGRCAYDISLITLEKEKKIR
jgi:protein SCO1/2